MKVQYWTRKKLLLVSTLMIMSVSGVGIATAKPVLCQSACGECTVGNGIPGFKILGYCITCGI